MILFLIQVVYREPRLDTGPKSVSLFEQTKQKIEEMIVTNGANFWAQVRPLYRERVKDEVYIATGVRPVYYSIIVNSIMSVRWVEGCFFL